jgi:hypothetical protein
MIQHVLDTELSLSALRDFDFHISASLNYDYHFHIA